MRKRGLIHGWGINDADYQVNATRCQPQCTYYTKWAGMVERGYSLRFKALWPTYELVTVNLVWQRFSNFRHWMQDQYWSGLELDKDILIMGNKEYGPETCAFVPPYINKLLNTSQPRAGKDAPLGVSVKDANGGGVNIYTAQCRPYSQEGNRYLGTFAAKEDAHAAWQLAKAIAIECAIEDYRVSPSFRQDVADALLKRVDLLRDDHANHRETFSL